MEYKIVLGLIAIILALISYSFYINDLFRNKTKPHYFSWFIWGLLAGIAFLAQLSEGGGAGSWQTGVVAGICLFIAFVAFYKYKNNYVTKFDLFCLAGTTLGIVLWITTNNPLTAVIIVSTVSLIALAPTFRKAYNLPYEETLITYNLNLIRPIISIIALETLNLTTWLFQASNILANILFITMLIIRRRIKNLNKNF